MNDDLTILIQGPINETSLNAIEDYLKFSKNIIISTWDLADDKIQLLKERFQNLCNLKIISVPQPNHVEMILSSKLFGIPTDTTFYWQIFGVYNGVMNCDTKYIIRTRSDEYFKNLEPLIDKFFNNDKKFTCGNIWFKPKSYRNLHIGDHLYISETEILKKCFQYLLDVFSGKYSEIPTIKNISYMHFAGGNNTPEQVLAKAYILAKLDLIDAESLSNIDSILDWQSDEICQNNFDVIDINELKPIKWNWTHGGVFGESFDSNEVITNIKFY